MKNILIGLLLLFGNVFGVRQGHGYPSNEQINAARQLYKKNAKSAIDEVVNILEFYKNNSAQLYGDVMVHGYGDLPCRQIIKALRSIDDKKIKLFADQFIVNKCSVIFPIVDEQNFSKYFINIIYSFSPSGLSFISSGVFWSINDKYNLKIGTITKKRTSKYFRGIFDLQSKILHGVAREPGVDYDGDFFCGMLNEGKITMCNAEYDVKRSYDKTKGRNKYIGEESLKSRDAIKNQKIKEMLFPNGNAPEVQMKLVGEFDHWCHEKGRIYATYLLNSNEYETEIGQYAKKEVNGNQCSYEITYNENVQAYIRWKICQASKTANYQDVTIVSCRVWCSQFLGLLDDPNAIIHVSFMDVNNVSRSGTLKGISTGFPISFLWAEIVKNPTTEFQFPIQRRGK